MNAFCLGGLHAVTSTRKASSTTGPCVLAEEPGRTLVPTFSSSIIYGGAPRAGAGRPRTPAILDAHFMEPMAQSPPRAEVCQAYLGRATPTKGVFPEGCCASAVSGGEEAAYDRGQKSTAS